MIRTIVALCFVFAVASARISPVRQCVNSASSGTIENVDVDPCDSDRCAFKPNTKVTIKGELTTTSTAANPTVSVQIEVGGNFIEYPGISKDACVYFSCPLKADAPNLYKIEVQSNDFLPPMDTKIQFHVYESEGGAELACIEADIAIIAA
ncbi:mite group 2 allergen Pso o 2-like [Tetranychus urticae]|uniref:MD-2-related lipid-recognition domain-containing protein n=1 Tax=Tetranychus urticae TaxID=32264 RepID=T1JQB7_TETUR|nr:mite group 2 allergen Pso o 2-like [Tetranychus urticae]